MLPVTIPAREWFDETNQEFRYTKEQTILIEHSLVSLSKWESKWKKPFLDPDTEHTYEESMDYVRCMTITQNVDPLIYKQIDKDTMDKINSYINDSMTATWFSSDKDKDKGLPKRKSLHRKKVTSELIYYWMITFGIPFECKKWHLNRLLTLIRVCNEENSSPKKMSKSEIMKQNAALNKARRARSGSRG